MPSANPNSPDVSFRAAAEPARSGGTDPSTRWVPSDTNGAAPMFDTAHATASMTGACDGTDPGHQRQPDHADDQPARNEIGRPDAACQQRRDEHGDDRRANGRQHPQAGPQRRQALDQLEMLGQEQHERAGQHRADEHRAERHREVAVGEQPHVEQRVLEPALAADEVHAGEGADHDGRDRHRLPAGAGELLQAVHDGQDRGERAEHADRVESARGWRLVFGQEHRDRRPAEAPSPGRRAAARSPTRSGRAALRRRPARSPRRP